MLEIPSSFAVLVASICVYVHDRSDAERLFRELATFEIDLAKCVGNIDHRTPIEVRVKENLGLYDGSTSASQRTKNIGLQKQFIASRN